MRLLAVLRKRNLRYYVANSEIMVFLAITAAAILFITVVLTIHQTYDGFLIALRHASFQTISVITSTGYLTKDFSVWPVSLPLFLLLISFIGGGSGSTAGGMKVIRIMLLFKQAQYEINKLIHPALVRPIRIAGRIYPKEVLSGVRGFFALYIAVFCLLILILMAGGLNQITAFSAVATCLNNMGPGLGTVSTHFQSIPDWQKLLLAFTMLLGRLERFTILVLLSPSCWRR